MIHDEDGATMVEYGLLIALIALVALAAIELLGSNLSALFNTVAGSV
jgi:pilus assembly protein Flp/PilA